jgi:hypothetical protein
MKEQQLSKNVATQANKTLKKAEIKDSLRNHLNCGESWIYLRNTNIQRNSFLNYLLEEKRK